MRPSARAVPATIANLPADPAAKPLRWGSGNPKLDMEKATRIRARHAEGESLYRLAAEYQVDRSTIRAVIAGWTWAPDKSRLRLKTELARLVAIAAMEEKAGRAAGAAAFRVAAAALRKAQP